MLYTGRNLTFGICHRARAIIVFIPQKVTNTARNINAWEAIIRTPEIHHFAPRILVSFIISCTKVIQTSTTRIPTRGHNHRNIMRLNKFACSINLWYSGIALALLPPSAISDKADCPQWHQKFIGVSVLSPGFWLSLSFLPDAAGRFPSVPAGAECRWC